MRDTLAEISARANAIGLIYDDDVEVLLGALSAAEAHIARLTTALVEEKTSRSSRRTSARRTRRRLRGGRDNMAIIEHELVRGGDGQHPDWEDRYNAQGATAARHLAAAREMLAGSPYGPIVLDRNPVGQLLLALDALLGMIYTPEEGPDANDSQVIATS